MITRRQPASGERRLDALGHRAPVHQTPEDLQAPDNARDLELLDATILQCDPSHQGFKPTAFRSPRYDIIILTCAAQYAPPKLFGQLEQGRRLVIPIGQPFKRWQFLNIYTKDADGKIRSRKDVSVFFIPMTQVVMEMQKTA